MKNCILFGLFLLSINVFSQMKTLDEKKILEQLQLENHGKTEVVKNFPKNFPNVLIERGTPIIYNKENSNNFEYIGMPIGGIATGQLYLGGDGQLWFWDIFGLNYGIGHLKGEEAYEFPYTRSNPTEKGARVIDQGFSITMKQNGKSITKTLNRDGFDSIEFSGQYPIGDVTYKDKELPIIVKSEVFSPFIPLDLDNSMIPTTIFNITIENISKDKIELDLEGWLENAVLTESRNKEAQIAGTLINTIEKTVDNGMRLFCSVQSENEFAKNQLDYGSMSLSMVGKEGKSFTTSKEISKTKLSKDAKLVGRLGKKLQIEPNQNVKVSFILSWHFPKTYATMYGTKDKEGNRIKQLMGDTIRYYSKVFKDAKAVSKYTENNLSKLSKTTRNWRDTWYDSTLPYWFLDRTFLNTSILASSTSSIIGDKMFYGSEGGNQGPGTCTHVWGYSQAPGRLFPEIEKGLRTKVDFKPVSEGGAMMENGGMNFRWKYKGVAVDGQSGIIVKTLQSHQMSPDNTFLKENYEGVKKAMQGLTAINDADHDGILTGPQHNTLDGTWYGKVTWLSLYYTTALRAMAVMADEMGDTKYANFCIKTANKGRKYIENNLFNGEYFIHEPDPKKPGSAGTYTGLEYSQLLGQSWAYQIGLGEVVDYKKAKTALESMWRYNFSTDVGPFREVHKTGRWYAMPGEGGLIACTWPRGGSEVLKLGNPRFAAYNNECQNGYEYAATSLMMWQGMPYHSLAHIWYMQNSRYEGSKRNPWCEIEWGLHYSRSMASYGHFVAVSGFEYHGPKGYMAFSPKITPENFKSAFTAAEGWGSFEQKQSKGKQTNSISLKYGKLDLKTIAFDVVKDKKIKEIKVVIAGKSIKNNSFTQKGNRVTITLREKATVLEGESLLVELK